MGRFYPIYEGIDAEYSRETEDKFVEILKEDDPEKFFKLLEEKKEEVVPDTHRNLLELCIEMKASKCTIAFLKAEFTEETRHLDLRNNVLIYLVKEWQDVQVLDTMFNECNGWGLASINLPYAKFLPIHKLLLDTMNEPPFSKWYAGDSLIKFVIMLICARATGMKPRLECLRLVADNTYQIKEVALGFFNGGDVKELAALLLLSYQKAFPHVKEGVTEEDLNDMISRAVHGENPDVFGLVHLFDKAGDSLIEFYTSLQEDVNIQDVIVEVARLFEKAGFQITYKDINLADVYSLEPAVMDFMCEALGLKLDEHKPRRKTFYPSVYCIPPVVAPGLSEDDIRVLRNRRFGFQNYHQLPVRHYSTVSHKVIASKQSLSSPSLRGVASLGMRLTRGIRFL